MFFFSLMESTMLAKMKMSGHLKTVAKTISWRLLGAVDTFMLSYLVTGKWTAAGAVVGFELLTKSTLYYGHERVWEADLITSLFNK